MRGVEWGEEGRGLLGLYTRMHTCTTTCTHIHTLTQPTLVLIREKREIQEIRALKEQEKVRRRKMVNRASKVNGVIRMLKVKGMRKVREVRGLKWVSRGRERYIE